MSESIFRQKSLDKVSSPEQLNDYISVTTPGVWMLIVSIILILIGVIVWGSVAELDTTVDAPVIIKDENATFYVKAEDALKVTIGKPVRIAKVEGKVVNIGVDSMKAEEVLGDFALIDAGYDDDTIVYPVKAQININDGIYRGQIVIDKVSPLSFLVNGEK